MLLHVSSFAIFVLDTEESCETCDSRYSDRDPLHEPSDHVSRLAVSAAISTFIPAGELGAFVRVRPLAVSGRIHTVFSYLLIFLMRIQDSVLGLENSLRPELSGTQIPVGE